MQYFKYFVIVPISTFTHNFFDYYPFFFFIIYCKIKTIIKEFVWVTNKWLFKMMVLD